MFVIQPCCINPIRLTTFPEWLSGTESWPRPPAPCVRARCVCNVFTCKCTVLPVDKAGTTADVQWQRNHRSPLWYHYFPAQSKLGADILVCWIGKIVRACVTSGSPTLDFLRELRTPYPLGYALRFSTMSQTSSDNYIGSRANWGVHKTLLVYTSIYTYQQNKIYCLYLQTFQPKPWKTYLTT